MIVRLLIFSWISIMIIPAFAQYQDLREALFTGFQLAGNDGPESVNWINNGKKFSYTTNGEIRSMTPANGDDQLIFSAAGLTFPGSNEPFEYVKFHLDGPLPIQYIRYMQLCNLANFQDLPLNYLCKFYSL